MENQLPLYLESHLREMGVLNDPRLSQQEEIYNPYDDKGFRMPELDDKGEPPF